ncbi:dimethylhistidine N-methyltransferase [Fodinibius salinus]|uniref:Dimethylhistidine N-methyltransferase n=1 Tax=Fodinibius salinus TaxID=860790 RepID=A0A5D3YIU5_9BACT|nr:L-histidine N(alpha)-methyltransferase [Fodinibius salinus]TYP93360.1 dimethylhistidine N-methyltransferase [Fodinibius salinus]
MENQVADTGQTMLDEVVEGLRKSQKQLPSKYFYDERGSELFEQITRLEEYYPTEIERSILNQNIDAIADSIGSKAMLVELGSGSSSKTRLLLEKLDSLASYVPVDISEEYLLKIVSNLRIEYPRISIIPVFADYTSHFKLPSLGDSYSQQVLFYPGSTIGNFLPEKARSFLSTLADITDPDAGMLIGVDLKKDKQLLESAYNDEDGITAKFNKNMLKRINRELGADFEINLFAHKAYFNEQEGRIEMHLVSQKKQEVQIADETFVFNKGESIHTENSYKYTLDEFEDLVSDSFSVEQVWTDEDDYFSVQYLSKK